MVLPFSKLKKTHLCVYIAKKEKHAEVPITNIARCCKQTHVLSIPWYIWSDMFRGKKSILTNFLNLRIAPLT